MSDPQTPADAIGEALGEAGEEVEEAVEGGTAAALDLMFPNQGFGEDVNPDEDERVTGGPPSSRSGRAGSPYSGSIPEDFLNLTPGIDRALQAGERRPWDPPQRQQTFTPINAQQEVQRVYSMEPAERARVQEMLVRAGALTGDFRYGGMDSATANALSRVIEHANMNEIGSIEEAAADMQKAKNWAERQGVPWSDTPGGGGGATPGGSPQQSRQRFQTPIYATPDPAKMRNDVREMFQSNVGRDPTDAELDEWVNRLAAADREEFEAGVEAERMQFEQQQDTPANQTTAEQILEGKPIEERTTRPGDPIRGGVAAPGATTPPEGGQQQGPSGGGEVQSVNSMARFEEELLNSLASEQEGQEEARDEQAGRRMTSQAFRRVGSLMGGGS